MFPYLSSLEKYSALTLFRGCVQLQIRRRHHKWQYQELLIKRCCFTVCLWSFCSSAQGLVQGFCGQRISSSAGLHSTMLALTRKHARTHSEGQTDHTLILRHSAPRANVPAVWVQLLYMGTWAYATLWLVTGAAAWMFHRIIKIVDLTWEVMYDVYFCIL